MHVMGSLRCLHAAQPFQLTDTRIVGNHGTFKLADETALKLKRSDLLDRCPLRARNSRALFDFCDR
jgi:hypothetical protein